MIKKIYNKQNMNTYKLYRFCVEVFFFAKFFIRSGYSVRRRPSVEFENNILIRLFSLLNKMRFVGQLNAP